jgi:hypothetical protein
LRVPRCVFICGCPHSGTSLVANILAAHPKIYIPLTETGIFLADPKIARWRFYHLLAKATVRNKLLVEKTPLHLHQLDKIRRIAKGCCFVIPVRDGRDVAASATHKHGHQRAQYVDQEYRCDRCSSRQRRRVYLPARRPDRGSGSDIDRDMRVYWSVVHASSVELLSAT